MKTKKAQVATDRLVILIIVILVVASVLLLVFRAEITKYISYIPSYGTSEERVNEYAEGEKVGTPSGSGATSGAGATPQNPSGTPTTPSGGSGTEPILKEENKIGVIEKGTWRNTIKPCTTYHCNYFFGDLYIVNENTLIVISRYHLKYQSIGDIKNNKISIYPNYRNPEIDPKLDGYTKDKERLPPIDILSSFNGAEILVGEDKIISEGDYIYKKS